MVHAPPGRVLLSRSQRLSFLPRRKDSLSKAVRERPLARQDSSSKQLKANWQQQASTVAGGPQASPGSSPPLGKEGTILSLCIQREARTSARAKQAASRQEPSAQQQAATRNVSNSLTMFLCLTLFWIAHGLRLLAQLFGHDVRLPHDLERHLALLLRRVRELAGHLCCLSPGHPLGKLQRCQWGPGRAGRAATQGRRPLAGAAAACAAAGASSAVLAGASAVSFLSSASLCDERSR